MFRKVRSLVAVLVLVLATASAAQAFPLARAVTQRGDFVEVILSWLTTAWAPVWERAGSDMDPNEEPESGGSPTADEDAGSQMDPNG